MMTGTEARKILRSISVDAGMVEKAHTAMMAKIEKSRKSGMYRKQGGVMFEFANGHVAWISIWKYDGKDAYFLNERGERLYEGYDTKECAEMLCKLGLAHKQYDNFLACY